MSKKRTSSSSSVYGNIPKWLQVVSVFFFIFILSVTGLSFIPRDTTVTVTPQAFEFPTVPPGGTRVVATRTYFHTSGLFSMPKLDGWEVSNNGEISNLPIDDSFKRAELTFINGIAGSVVHGFIERDPKRESTNPITDVNSLNKYYDDKTLAGAWTQYTGGWRETGRRIENDSVIIDFELKLNQTQGTQTYYGRQISALQAGWIKVLRLVSPDNNRQLLDQLQQAVWPHMTMYPAALNSPLNWTAVTDFATGYQVRFPNQWNVQGLAGEPYSITGSVTVNNKAYPVTMVTKTTSNMNVADEAAVKAWVTNAHTGATILAIKPDTREGATGFNVSYIAPDTDGNKRSGAILLLNGPNNTLYSVDQLTNILDVDLLDTTLVSVPPELAQIRASVFFIPTDTLVATATPLPTMTPLPTIPVTTVPTLIVPTATPNVVPTANRF